MEKEQEHIDELISDFLSAELSSEEQKRLDAWISESEENWNYFMQRQEIWFSSLHPQASERYNAEKAFEVFKKRIDRPKKHKKGFLKRQGMKSIFKYAAAISILIMISYFSYWEGQEQITDALTKVQVEAPAGSQARVNLPDGTTVLLNAGSSLVYAQDFGLKERMVKLQGEGYFEVAHNAQIPFYVQTKELKVKVLGTKFNVCDYPEDTKAVVSLLEGKVALDNLIDEKAKFTLHPNERVVLDKQDGEMIKENADAASDVLWAKGKLVFQDTPLAEVVKILERTYGVKISADDELLKNNFLFCGSFNISEQNVQDVLSVLSATGRIHYILQENDIIIY